VEDIDRTISTNGGELINSYCVWHHAEEEENSGGSVTPSTHYPASNIAHESAICYKHKKKQTFFSRLSTKDKWYQNTAMRSIGSTYQCHQRADVVCHATQTSAS